MSPPITPNEAHSLENQNILNVNYSPNVVKTKMLTSSLKTSLLGLKVIRIEIYRADQFENSEDSSCRCKAEICAQHVVSNYYSDHIYSKVREILKSMDSSICFNL